MVDFDKIRKMDDDELIHLFIAIYHRAQDDVYDRRCNSYKAINETCKVK